MNKINISWWNKDGANWGDALNPILGKLISGKEINWVKTGDDSNVHRYYCIGSILQSSMSTESEIWGTGFMRGTHLLKVKPKKIHAVRGPLTRQSLIEQGYECPEVYGDPALLYPRFYNPDIEVKYKIGIIPHYIDQKVPWLDKFRTLEHIKIINILDPINKVVDDIKSCEMIISSSLHGVIAGDAYGIPSKWILLSDKVGGGGFKFQDYFASVGRTDTEPLVVRPETRLIDIYKLFVNYEIDIDLDLLYNSCPFKK